ncbi:MAG: hypothetical protein IEMM0002_1306 [bacterium]|nr:MAG: hypothetical protein IEMM0002_1306 [bacterium]
MDKLLEEISALVKDAYSTPPEEPVVTRTRHLEIFVQIVNNLERAKEELPWGRELAASSIWNALEEIKRFTGQSYTEEVLSTIFNQFCIGK